MNTRYVYNPYSDEPIVSSIHCLIVLKRSFEEFTRLLEHMNTLAKSYEGDKLIRQWTEANDYGGLLIREMRLVPRSYYEYWMLHRMIRMTIYIAMRIDIAKLWVYQNQGVYEPDSLELLKLRVMLEGMPMQKLSWPKYE